ncbi:MAG: MFS transporter [Nitratireductor sp.]|nr:MFS transporter [Nitratireductor sp.]
MTSIDVSGGVTQGPGDKPADKRGIWGWMLFDWAAQPFFTVVTTFIFGPYFISRMVLDANGNPDPAAGQAAWGFAIAIGGVVMAILAPILGSIADQTGPRKPWIAFFAIFQIGGLLFLWNAAPGSSIFWVLFAYTVAAIAAEFSTVFNDSMLPRLVGREKIGEVSGTAWGLGYLGGMIVLIAVLLFLAGNPTTGKTLLGIDPLFGLDPATGEDARQSGPFSALWYFIFILPMFFFTPDGGTKRPLGLAVSKGLSELAQTLRDLRQRAGLVRFLVARMIYQDGVGALLALGGGFAAGMFKWSVIELGIYGIILNVVAIGGSIAGGRLDTRKGSKWIVVLSVLALVIATIGIISTGPGYTLFGLIDFGPEAGEGLFSTGAEKAYIVFGLLIGLVFGPVQASSRAYMARSVSEDETGRYFGIYALSGRATSFLCPFLVASVTTWSGSARLGMVMILPFFVIGLLVLLTAPYPAHNPEK